MCSNKLNNFKTMKEEISGDEKNCLKVDIDLATPLKVDHSTL